MPYDIYVLPENLMTIAGGQLDGVDQGDGSHLDGLTITLNSSLWVPISINDDDTDFSDNDSSQTLNGDQTIGTETFTDGTRVEAEFSFVLSDGVNEWTVIAFNVNNSSPSYATVEGLAFIGGPGGFPPRDVPLTVSDPGEGPSFAQAAYATPVCFTSAMRIETAQGPRRADQITPGMLLKTRDHGLQRVLWTGSRTAPAAARFTPVHIAAGTLGSTDDLLVSQQHRVLLTGWQAEMLFGQPEVLVPARYLTDLPGVTLQIGGAVTYHHFLLEEHAVLSSGGLWSESFHLGHQALRALLPEAHDQIRADFPELIGRETAYQTLRKHEAAALVGLAA
ncbi:Hint domain-containing protein [Roseobacter sp. A03A-229]